MQIVLQYLHNFLRIVLLPTRILLLLILNNNAYHTAIAVIDNFLQSILQLQLAILRHLGHLGLDTVLHNLFNGFGIVIKTNNGFILLLPW